MQDSFAFNKFTWVQLSDLHIIAHAAGTHEVREAYREIIEVQKIQPDIVFVTGDFRYKRNNTEFADAISYLEELLAYLHVEKKDVFFVPGNHDVNDRLVRIQEKIDAIVVQSEIDNQAYWKEIDLLYRDFSEYNEMVEEFYKNAGLEADDERLTHPADGYSVVWNNRLNIIGLNTALISDSKRNPDNSRAHKELVDINSMWKIKTRKGFNKGLPSIVLGHHRIEDIFSSHQRSVKSFLKRCGAAAYLNGDVHQFGLSSALSPIQELSIPEITCGKSAPEANDDWSEVGFNKYIWEKDSFWVYPYKYDFIEDSYQFKPSDKFNTAYGAPHFPLKIHFDLALIDSDKVNGRVVTKDDLDEYLIGYLDDPDFAKIFLKSGPSTSDTEEVNLDGHLTPQIFKEHFLIRREDWGETHKKIIDLFKSGLENKLIIEAGSGSGKTVFINTLPLHDEDENIYETVVFDFANCMYPGTNSAAKATIELLRLKLREIYHRAINQGKIQLFLSKQKEFFSNITAIIDPSENVPLSSLLALQAASRMLFSNNETKILQLAQNPTPEVVVRLLTMFDESFSEFLTSVEKDQRINTDSSSKTEIEGYADVIDSIYKTEIATTILLYIGALEAIRESQKYLIAFDNLEAYVRSSAKNLLDTVNFTYKLARNIFKIYLQREFFTNYTFVLMIRTANSVYLKSFLPQHGQNSYIHSLQGQDFLIQAILKKLRYIATLRNLYHQKTGKNVRDTRTYKTIFSLLQLFLPEKTIKEFIDGDETSIDSFWEGDQRGSTFVERMAMPLFNYDYRNTISILMSIVLHNDSVSHAEKVNSIVSRAKDLEIRTAGANGIHMILLRGVYQQLHDMKVFRKIGLLDIGRRSPEEFSITRAILVTLYWQTVKDSYMPDESAEVKLSDFFSIMKYYYTSDAAEFVKGVFLLSQLRGYTEEEQSDKRLIFENWTNLILIADLPANYGIKKLSGIFKAIANGEKSLEARQASIKLTPAGSYFVRSGLSQFEFVLSRGTRYTLPLFAYPLNSEKDLSTIEKACNLVENTVKAGILAFMRRSFESCFLFKHNTPQTVFCVKKEKCSYATEERRPRKKLLDCSLYQRYNEGLLTIVDCIDYIDRYRIYVYYMLSDNSSLQQATNSCLLSIICKFGEQFNYLKGDIATHFRNGAMKTYGDFMMDFINLSKNIGIELFWDNQENDENDNRDSIIRCPRRCQHYFMNDDGRVFNRILGFVERYYPSYSIYTIWKRILGKQEQQDTRIKEQYTDWEKTLPANYEFLHRFSSQIN